MKILFSILFIGFVMACNAQTDKIIRVGIEKMTELSQDENTVIMDVRTPGEIAESYLKGTTQFIDFNGTDFKEKINALDKSKTYVVYCRSGNRSTKALNYMAEQGFEKLYELEGGIKSVTDDNNLVK